MKKIAAFAAAFALTAAVSAMTSFAAEGWAQENDKWVYYNSAGYKVTDTWKGASDGYSRYLDGNGYMAVSCWVDDDNYYVDESGICLKNTWLQVENTDDEDKEYDYYYFSSTGKAAKDKWEQVNGKWYHFDTDGVMETGWILEDMYYTGDDGAMVTGWQKLTPPDGYDTGSDTENHTYVEGDEDSELVWYYFNTSGKKVVPDTTSEYDVHTKKINGTTYCMDETGALLFGWVCTQSSGSDNIEDYRYVDENGQVRTGWYSIEPPSAISGKYEHDVEWFYFSKKGVPTVGPAEGEASVKDFKKIGGYTYLFNENGVPVYGLQKVYSGTDYDDYSAYYFGTRSQSALLKGKYSLDESEGTVSYYFGSSGKGYTGVYDNYLYYMGKLQKADSSAKYEVYTIYKEGKDSYTNYVVNTSGKVQKSTTVKDSSGVKYKTSSSGSLLKEDGEEADGTYTSPSEPDWSYDE